MPTYLINTEDRSFKTRSSRDAAEVACNWKRHGLDPSAYVVKNRDGLAIDQVEISTVAETAKRLANA